MYTEIIIMFCALVLLAGTLSLIPLIIQAQVDEPVSWETFKDAEGLFTIQYPSNWEPLPSSNSSDPIDTLFFYEEESCSGEDCGFAYLDVVKFEAKSAFTTARDILESRTEANEVQTNYEVERPIECSRYMINDMPACSIIVSFTMPEEGERTVMNLGAIDRGGAEYSLDYVATPDLFRDFFPVAQSMIKSFQLTEDAAVTAPPTPTSTLPDKFGLDKTQDIMLENGTSYPIKYKITGGQVSNMGLERFTSGAPSLFININTRPQDSDFGKIVVEIPNTVLDSNRNFIVYSGEVGGGNSPTESKKLASDSDSAIVEAEFWNGSSDGYPLSTIEIVAAG
jgi:hypothetical protein